MKSLSLLVALSISFSVYAAKVVRPEIMASLKVENENTQYKILNNHSDKEALLERTSSKLSNKTIKIPKGLAEHIKSDLLALSWQSRYKPSRKAASGCDLAATVFVETEDTVRICQDNRHEASRALEIQKQLNELISARN
jgi:hypothetical protein